MTFTRFVEVGRLCKVENTVGWAVITEIISTNRVLCVFENNKRSRLEVPLRRVTLSNYTVSIQRGAKTAAVLKALKEALPAIEKEHAARKSGLKANRSLRKRQTTDFERFKIMVLKKRV